jgi:hypothetical protein
MYKNNRLFSVAIFLLVMFLVLLNIFTPLRLNTDGIRYLNIIEYLNGNLDKNSGAARDFLPHGYPLFLLFLQKMHLLCPAVITLINIFCVLISSYILAKSLKIENKLIYFSIIMISFINIKQFTLPVSDQFFTLLFVWSIYFWINFFNGRLYFIIPALIITIISIYVRTAGIAVVVGVLLYIIYLNKKLILNKKILLGFIAILFIFFIVIFIDNLSFFEKKIDYIRQLEIEGMIKNPFSIIKRLSIHIQELGEVVINIPYSKLSSIIHLKGFDISLLITAGIVSLYVICKSVAYLKLYNSFVFWAFLSYLIMIFLWPFYDTRFLIPVIPLFIYLFYYYISKLFKIRYIKILQVVLYVSLGLISLAYSDLLSLNKSFFLKHYGFDPQLTGHYRIHFRNQTLDASQKPVYDINKNNELYLLEKYDTNPLATKFNAATK